MLESIRRWLGRRSFRSICGDTGDGQPVSKSPLVAPPARCLKPMELLEGLLSDEGNYAFSCAFTLWFLIEKDFPALRKKLTNENFALIIEVFREKAEAHRDLRDELLKILCFLSKQTVVNWDSVAKEERQRVVDILLGVLHDKLSTSEACRHAVRLLMVCECDIEKSFQLLDGCVEMLKKDYSIVTVLGREIVEYSCMLIGLLFRNARVKARKQQHVYAHYVIGKGHLMRYVMEYLVKHNPADSEVRRNGMRLAPDNTVQVFVWEYLAELLIDVMFFARVEGIVFLYTLGFFDYIFDLFHKPNHQGRFKAARLLDEAFEKDENFFSNVLHYHNAKMMAKIFLEVLHDPNEDRRRVFLVLSFSQELFAKANPEQLKDLCELGLICVFFHNEHFKTGDSEAWNNDFFALHCIAYDFEGLLEEYCKRNSHKLLNREREAIKFLRTKRLEFDKRWEAFSDVPSRLPKESDDDSQIGVQINFRSHVVRF